MKQKEINQNQINEVIKMIYESVKIPEISKKTGISIKKIQKIKKENNITFKLQRGKTNRIIKIIHEILRLHSENNTCSEIMEKLNISKNVVLRVLKENNLAYIVKDVNPEINLTYEEEQVLIGGLFGDSYLGISKRNKYPHGCIGHCIEQYDYAVFKQKFINRFTSQVSLVNKFDKRSGRKYQQAWIVIRSQKALLPYYYSFYNDSKKTFSKDMLYKIDPLGLAIWYMDDGSPSYTTYGSLCGFLFATMCFSDEEINLIKKFFKEKFNLETTIHKDRSIYIKAESRDVFLNLISKYIPDCMKYKISNKIINK